MLNQRAQHLALGRSLARALSSRENSVREFGERMLEKAASHSRMQNEPIVKAFREIQLQAGPDGDFTQAALRWLADERSGSSEAKTEFLLVICSLLEGEPGAR